MCCSGLCDLIYVVVCVREMFLKVRAGKVFAAATEDMDALTFGSNILLRHMTFSEARKMPIQEFHLDKVLEGLNLNQSQVRFVPSQLSVFAPSKFFSLSICAFCSVVITLIVLEGLDRSGQ